jgi:hypothetical protein
VSGAVGRVQDAHAIKVTDIHNEKMTKRTLLRTL